MINKTKFTYTEGTHTLQVAGPAEELLEIVAFLLDDVSLAGRARRSCYEVFEEIGD